MHVFRCIDTALSPVSSGLYPQGKYRSKLRCMGWKLSIHWEAEADSAYEIDRPWKTSALCLYNKKIIGMTVTYHPELVKNWQVYQYAFRTAIGCVLAHEYAHAHQRVEYIARSCRQQYRMTPLGPVAKLRSIASYRTVPAEFSADTFAFCYYIWRYPRANIFTVVENTLMELCDKRKCLDQLLSNQAYIKKLSTHWNINTCVL